MVIAVSGDVKVLVGSLMDNLIYDVKRLCLWWLCSKIVAKAEASQKRKASTSGATSSHVVKRTRSALAQSSSSTTHPILFMGDDDDDDACVEIMLVTPLRSNTAIPSSGNQGRSSATPTAEGSKPRDSRGKGVMVDDAAALSAGVSRPRPSSGPAPSFRNVSGDAILTDFFPFFAGPYYVTYPKDGVAGNSICKTIIDQFPTPRDMVLVESLSDDQLAAKMSVLHCMMMSHGGELLARYRRLNQSHHEYVLSTDSRLKGYKEKVASLSGLELQVSALKKRVSDLNDKLSSSDASFTKSKAKGKERKKKIKSLTKSVDNLHSKVARLSVALNQATIYEHATEPLSVILQLEPKKLVRPANVPASREARVSPPTKESIVTPAFKYLEWYANVNFTASVVAPEHNEEMLNAKVDGSGPKMTDDTAAVKSGHAFVQGISVALDDVMELVEVGSGRVSSCPNDVVVALFDSEKGDGLGPSSVAGEEAVANPSEV
ncbi:hypothetical protein Tco_0499446 [Tanacetum coccineum]